MTAPAPVGTGAAAKALNISRATLARWAAAGHVTPAQRTVGGHLRWDLDQLRREIAEITSPDQGTSGAHSDAPAEA